MIKKLLVSFLGSGYLPLVPGTWGSLVASIIYLLLANSRLGNSHPTLWLVTAGLTVLATVIGIALGKWAVGYYESDDPKPFVLDEVAIVSGISCNQVSVAKTHLTAKDAKKKIYKRIFFANFGVFAVKNIIRGIEEEE
jgi:phosphatidylglycerophosphatase A